MMRIKRKIPNYRSVTKIILELEKIDNDKQ